MAEGNKTVDRHLDWRDRAFYPHVDRYSDRCWAWEGLRRNREFQDAWHAANAAIEVVDFKQGIRVVKSNESRSSLNRWGVLYSDSPDIDASSAAVVWRTDRVYVLNVVALPAEISRDLSSFRLKDARCSTVVICAADGFQHVLSYSVGCSVQLKVSGGSVLQPTRLLTEAAPDLADLKSRLLTMARFGELYTLGKCESGRRVPKARADRLRLVIQALDGFLRDATLREIGVVLFGAERVEKDWDDDHRHLKDRVRRAVARGRWLMEGGYMKYLR